MDRLPSARLADRIAQGRALARASGVSALLLYAAPRRVNANQSSGNVAYFTGWTPPGGPSLLLLPADGRPVVFATGPNEARVFRDRAGDLVEVRVAGLRAMATAAAAALDALGIGPDAALGLAGGDELPGLAWRAFASVFAALVPIDAPLHALRLTRHADEMALHARACAISDRMLQRAMDLAVVPAMTPAQLMAEVEFTGRRMGADVATLWLATGEEPPTTWFEFSELPAAIGPRDRIQLGTNVAYESHFAQGLRIGVRGAPPQKLIEYDVILRDIQDAALAEMVPGNPVHRVVDVLEHLTDRYCPYTRATDPFRFQSCHGMGLNYAEPALATALSPDRDRSRDGDGPVIAENMVIQIHPNFTVPGLGHICAGDVAVVTATGAAWMTAFPRGLVRLD